MVLGEFPKQLMLLWLGIAATRIILQFGLSFGITNFSVLNGLFGLFAIAVFATEAAILRHAARRYAEVSKVPTNSIGSDAAKPVTWRTRRLKLFIGLMMFCLPFGIWTLRFEHSSVLPMLIGTAANLLLTYGAVCALFRLGNHPDARAAQE